MYSPPTTPPPIQQCNNVPCHTPTHQQCDEGGGGRAMGRHTGKEQTDKLTDRQNKPRAVIIAFESPSHFCF